MADKESNPLNPLMDVGLRPDDKAQMRKTLLQIMLEEESELPSPRPVVKKRNMQRIANIFAGAAAVILVAGVLMAGTHHHWFQSHHVTAQQHLIKSNPVHTQKASTGVPFSSLGAKSLDAVSFISDKIGFVAGQDGIYRTTDGGATWEKVYSSNEPILGIQAKYQSVAKEEYVVAYTKTHLLRSSDGQHFTMQGIGVSSSGGASSANIEGVSLLNNNMVYLLNSGVVWQTNGEDGALYRSTPTTTVSSIAATWDTKGAAVCYAVSGTSVYKTTDSRHWVRMVTVPIDTRLPWKTEIQVLGKHIAVLFYGGDAGMSQSAYILYESNDAGKTWTAMVDEGYFASDYKGAKTLDKTNTGEIPGPFAMDANGNLLVTGYDENGSITILTTVTPEGKTIVHDPVGPSANSPNVFDFPATPIAIATSDGKHIFIVGSKANKGVIEKSQDGGLTWRQG